MTERDHVDSRRGFLSTLGATAGTGALAALAGCSVVSTGDGSDSVTFHARELPEIDDDPVVALGATYPVAVPRAHRGDAQRRANDLLERVPTPLGSRRVPNGHVRAHLTDAVTEARDRLDDALRAPTPRETLESLRQARERARYAGAGWAAIADDLAESDLEAEAGDVEDRAYDALDALEYVGTDRAPAVVVHASRERLLDDALSVSRDVTHDGVRVLRVAEYASHVERGAAALADATTVGERFRASQPDDADSLRPVIETARDRLRETIRGELDDLPSDEAALTVEGADLEDGRAVRVLHDLHYRAADADPARSPYGSASAILDAIRQLAAIRAYRAVRGHISAGRRYEITGADAVSAAYARAHEALRAAPRRSAAPGLARAALQYTADGVRYADERLAGYTGELRLHDVGDPYEWYVVHGAIAETTPVAVDTAVDALDAE